MPFDDQDLLGSLDPNAASATGVTTPPFAPSQNPTDMGQVFGQWQQNAQGTRNQLDALIQQLKDQVSSTSPLDKQVQDMLHKTIEQRKQELIDKALGVSRTPVWQNTPIPGVPGVPTGEVKTKTNWWKALPALLKEGVSAIAQGNNYKPLEDRMRDVATQQYGAEAGPIMRELAMENQNRRNILNNLRMAENSKMMADWHTGTTLAAQQRAQIAQQAQDLKASLNPYLKAKYGAQIDNLKATAEKSKAQTELTNVNVELNQIKQEILKSTLGLTGDAATAAVTSKLSPDARAAWEKAYEKIQQDKNAFKPMLSPTTFGDNPAVFNKRTGQYLVNGVPQGGAAAGQTGAQNTQVVPTSTVNQSTNTPIQAQPQAVNQKPKDYYSSAYVLPITYRFPDAPKGSDPSNDPVLAYPVRKLSAANENAAAKSLTLFTSGRDLSNFVKNMSPNDFGTLKGNALKVLSNKTTALGPQETAEVHALIQYANALAVTHVGAQTMRSAQMAEQIAKEIAALGTDKNTVLKGIKGYTDLAAENLRHYPEYKPKAAVQVGSYKDLAYLFNPDIYKKLYPETDENPNIIKMDSIDKMKDYLKK